MSLVLGTSYQIPGSMGLDKSLAPETWYQTFCTKDMVSDPVVDFFDSLALNDTPLHPTPKLHATKPTYTLYFVGGLAQWNEPRLTRSQ